MGFIFVYLGNHYRHDLALALLSLLLAFEFITITLIDFRYKIIPDELSLSLLAGGLLLSTRNPIFLNGEWHPFWLSLLSAFGGGTFMYALAVLGEKLFHQEALGGGDIKLVAGIGACLGWKGLYGTLLLGSLSGGCVGLALLMLHKKSRKDAIPFGPFLCFGAAFSFLFPSFLEKVLFP